MATVQEATEQRNVSVSLMTYVSYYVPIGKTKKHVRLDGFHESFEELEHMVKSVAALEGAEDVKFDLRVTVRRNGTRRSADSSMKLVFGHTEFGLDEAASVVQQIRDWPVPDSFADSIGGQWSKCGITGINHWRPEKATDADVAAD